MDTVGTFSMAKALATFGILTAVHKHYTAEEWLAFTRGRIRRRTQACDGFHRHVRCGFRKTQQILSQNPQLNFVCIDVANGYSEHFVQFVAKAREAPAAKNYHRRERGHR